MITNKLRIRTWCDRRQFYVALGALLSGLVDGPVISLSCDNCEYCEIDWHQ